MKTLYTMKYVFSSHEFLQVMKGFTNQPYFRQGCKCCATQEFFEGRMCSHLLVQQALRGYGSGSL